MRFFAPLPRNLQFVVRHATVFAECRPYAQITRLRKLRFVAHYKLKQTTRLRQLRFVAHYKLSLTTNCKFLMNANKS